MFFITGSQILAHVVGDYFLQSSWMALEKTKRFLPAATHALAYTVPFLFITHSAYALTVICSTHFVIDRWRLARHISYLKQFLAPPSWWSKWSDCKETGLHKDTPAWLIVWLMIIVDNTMHIVINALAITYLGAM